MQIVTKRIIIHSKKDSNFSIVPLGDIHLGNIGCDSERFFEYIQWIKNTPRTYWIGMGDYIDAINYLDPRFDSRQVDPRYVIKLRGKDKEQTFCLEDMVHRQADDFINYVNPIKDKCLGLITGNHEETVRKFHHIDVTNAIAYALGVPYLGYTAFLKVNIERRSGKGGSRLSYVFYLSHGYGASRKSGAKINRIEDACHFFDCDVVLMAHEHKKLYTTVTKLGINESANPSLQYKKTVGVMTGCFLKGYIRDSQNYVEKAGFSPTDIGTAKIMICGVEKNVHVSL